MFSKKIRKETEVMLRWQRLRQQMQLNINKRPWCNGNIAVSKTVS